MCNTILNNEHCIALFAILYDAHLSCLQYGFSTKMLGLLSKPQLLEQAGKTTVEQCLTVIVLSLAMVGAITYNLLLTYKQLRFLSVHHG